MNFYFSTKKIAYILWIITVAICEKYMYTLFIETA